MFTHNKHIKNRPQKTRAGLATARLLCERYVSQPSAKMKDCISILSRELWIGDEMISPCCCLFIGFSDGSWSKVFYDDECCKWVLIESDETPDETRPLGDDEFKYPYKQYLPAKRKAVGQLIQHKSTMENVLSISFSSGFSLTLSYNPVSECENIETNT